MTRLSGSCWRTLARRCTSARKEAAGITRRRGAASQHRGKQEVQQQPTGQVGKSGEEALGHGQYIYFMGP
ncbi:hypothetical protein BZL41_11780 [Pseudomonas sp. PIC25]|nr:hypothetical protein BZL41_11780 [Pseudomonas sp. PIC25]